MSCKSKVLQRVCLQQGGSGSPQTPEEIIIPPELSVFAAFVRSCANREDLERTLTEIIAPRYSLLLSALDAWSAARSKNNFSGLADIERYNVALTDARQGILSDLYLMMGVDQSAFPRLGMNREERARGDYPLYEVCQKAVYNHRGRTAEDLARELMSGLDAQPHKILRIILNEDTWGGLAGERLERNRIEVALRSGQSVPLDALVKYPDLIIHHGVDL